MSAKEAADQALHVALSAAGLIPLPLVYHLESAGWAYLLAGTASGLWFAWWREDAQHRPEEGWSWPFRGRGGRWLDIAFGTLGGLLVGALAASVL